MLPLLVRSRRFRATLALLLLGVLSSIAQAQCVNYESYLHWLGRAKTIGAATGIARQGNYVFVSNDTLGLATFDLAAGTVPTLLSTTETPAARDVAVSGARACIVDYEEGLIVFDVSNPAAPARLANRLTPGSALHVVMSGNIAYVACFQAGFTVYDISGASPVLLKQVIPAGETLNLMLVGHYLYTSHGSAGMRIYDVAVPSNPTLVTTRSWRGDVMVARGSRAYIGSNSFGAFFYIVDITNPAAPALLQSYPNEPDWYVSGIEASGNLLHVCYPGSGYRVWDISNLAAPQLLGRTNRAGLAYCELILDGERAIAAGKSLEVFDVSSPLSAPTYWVSSALVGEAHQVETLGSAVYVAGYGLQIWDATNPAAPVQVGTVLPSVQLHTMEVDGSHAYVATFNFNANPPSRLYTLDLADPLHPADVFNRGYDNPIQGIDSDGGILAISVYHEGIELFDNSDPSAPTLVGTVSLPSLRGEGLRIVGDLLYLPQQSFDDQGAEVGALYIYDISSLAAPVQLSRLEIPLEVVSYCNWVEVAGTTAYVGCWQDGFAVVDCSDPSNPILGDLFQQGGLVGTHGRLVGNRLYMSSQGFGVDLFDVTQPLHPRPIGNTGRPLWVNASVPHGDYLYTVGTEFGVFPNDCGVAAEVEVAAERAPGLRAVPNPTSGEARLYFADTDNAPRRLDIFDAGGRMIRELDREGTGALVWDGRDRRGRPVASGVYLVRVKGGDTVGRIVLRR